MLMNQKYPTYLSKLFLITCLSSVLINLSACQKNDDERHSDIKVTEITPNENDVITESGSDANNDDAELMTLNSHLEVESNMSDNPSDSDLDNRVSMEGATFAPANELGADRLSEVSVNNDTEYSVTSMTDPNVKAETQITDVEYKDDSGQSIYVTFQTSAVETLEADLRLPSGKRVLLTAPKGQGNNPTYRSKDGSIELVTHGGGNSIDLMVQGQLKNYEAVKAEAEVLKPQ